MKEKFDDLVAHFVRNGFFLEEAVELLERRFIEDALERTQGNRSLASKVLGIHRNTLQRKMAQYELGVEKRKRKPVRKETRSRGKSGRSATA